MAVKELLHQGIVLVGIVFAIPAVTIFDGHHIVGADMG